jgi:hypothetical protein
VTIDPEAPRADHAPYGRPDWQPGWCAAAINAAVKAGLCTDAEAPRLLQALAADPGTKSPKRLVTRLGVQHARHLLGNATAPPEPSGRHRRAWCGVGACHPRTRRLEDPETGADRGACPRCHNSAPDRAALPNDLRIDVGGGVNADGLPAKDAPTGAPTPGVPAPPPSPTPLFTDDRQGAPA